MIKGIVATFNKSAGGRLTMHAMTTLTEETIRSTGEIYLSWTGYDVDWSRTYGSYLIHQSSGGGGGEDRIDVDRIYFKSGDIKVRETPTQLVDAFDEPPWRSKRTQAIRKRNRTRELKRLPKAFNLRPGEDLLSWMDRNAIHEDAVFCAECRDFLPGDQLCKHCWWCDKTGWYSTPGDRCPCKSREECRDLE